jgi:DNA-binding transcriptional LysR family regulator
MNYTLHQLQVFTTVVKTKSITKAARELFLTQPGVSIQLKNFQDQFDVQLTEVIGRQLYITDFGNEIAVLAHEILAQVDQINLKTAAYKGIMVGRLKVAVVSTGKYVMPYFLAGFLKEHPQVDLTMDVTNKMSVLKSLEGNVADFALVSILPDKLAVNEEILLENKLYLVSGGAHPDTANRYGREIFEQLPMIYREQGSATRAIMEAYLEKSKISVVKKMELTSNEAVKQAIIAGIGYSIMPLIGIRNEIKTGELKILPVVGFPIRSQWRLIFLKNKKLSPVADAYLKYLQKHKADIVEGSFSWIRQSGHDGA